MNRRVVLVWSLIYCLSMFFTAKGQDNPYPPPQQNTAFKNLEIARELIDNNKEGDALKYLNACLAKRPHEKEAIFMRARIYNNKGMLLEALTDYNSLLSIEPENREALYSRGIVRYQLKQYDMALQDFLKVRSLPPDGETKTAYFKTDETGKMVTGIATMSTMEAEILNYTGLCYFHMNNYQKSIEAYSEGIATDPSADLYVNRALAREEAGDIEGAISDYEFVVKNYPGHPQAAWNLMNLKKNTSKKDERLKDLNRFIEQFPDMANGYASRGMYYYEQNNFDAATRDMQEAVSIEPDNEDYLFNLGLCYIKTGELNKAGRIFEKLTAMAPSHSGAWFNLGNIRYKLTAYDEAVACFTIALQFSPGNARILYNRALAYFQSDMLREACADMKKVLDLDPDMGKVKKFLSKHCEGQ